MKAISADAPRSSILRLVLPIRKAELAPFGQALGDLRAPARDFRTAAI
jgi:hypothetical protein